jgi:hypothetical protein
VEALREAAPLSDDRADSIRSIVELDMTGTSAAIADAYRKNLERYCQLLALDLTQTEREYIHRRIAETRLALDRIEASDTACANYTGPCARPVAALATARIPPRQPSSGAPPPP